MSGFRYLPWRIKLKWIAVAFAIMMAVNLPIFFAVKNNEIFLNSVLKQELKSKQDSLKSLGLKLDSLNNIKKERLDSIQIIQERLNSLRLIQNPNNRDSTKLNR